MNTHFLERPKLYKESFFDQEERITRDLKKATEEHTLLVVRRISDWLEIQKVIGNEFKGPDVVVEAETQCKLHGVNPSHIGAATIMITEIYVERAARC